MFDALMVFLKEFFEKVDFEKSADDKKKHSELGISENSSPKHFEVNESQLFCQILLQLKNCYIELFTSHYKERTSGMLTSNMKLGILKALKVCTLTP